MRVALVFTSCTSFSRLAEDVLTADGIAVQRARRRLVQHVIVS